MGRRMITEFVLTKEANFKQHASFIVGGAGIGATAQMTREYLKNREMQFKADLLKRVGRATAIGAGVGAAISGVLTAAGQAAAKEQIANYENAAQAATIQAPEKSQQIMTWLQNKKDEIISRYK